MYNYSEIKVKQLEVGGFDHNFSYVVYDAKKNFFLIDPTGDREVINHFLMYEFGDLQGRAEGILLTHSHLDHCENASYFSKKFNIPVYGHCFSKYPDIVPLLDGDRITVDGEWFISCIYTPGHTDDSVCYALGDDSAIFTGDTLFVDYVGFGEAKELYESLYRRLKVVPDWAMVYSGHDYGNVKFDTMGDERKHNNYLTAANFGEFKLRLDLMK